MKELKIRAPSQQGDVVVSFKPPMTHIPPGRGWMQVEDGRVSPSITATSEDRFSPSVGLLLPCQTHPHPGRLHPAPFSIFRSRPQSPKAQGHEAGGLEASLRKTHPNNVKPKSPREKFRSLSSPSIISAGKDEPGRFGDVIPSV